MNSVVSRLGSRHAGSRLLRNASTIAYRQSSTLQAQQTRKVNQRWLSELQKRIKQCLAMKLDAKQAAGLRECASYLDQNWLELSAGLEGFLADEKLRGVHRHAVQWGDVDSMVRHVNNVIYNRFAESGRFNWFRNLADLAEPQYTQQWLDLTGPRGVGLILASIKTDYKFPMTYPDRVTVLHKLTGEPKPDSDRFDLEVVIYSENQRRPAARCFEDIVVYDYQAGKKAALKPFVVDKFRELWDLQLQRQKESENKVAELQDIVTEIEKSI